MIEVCHLVKRYGKFTAVDDLSFKFLMDACLGLWGQMAPAKPPQCGLWLGYCARMAARFFMMAGK